MNNTQGSRVIALGSSTYVRGNAAAYAAALFLAFLFIYPFGAYADDGGDFNISPNNDLTVSHAGITMQTLNVNTISGASLTDVDNIWTITTNYPLLSSGNLDVDQFVYILMRGEPGNIEGGTPIEGVNYSVASSSLQTGDPHTEQVSFTLPSLGDLATPSGTYTLIAARLPQFLYVYDDAIDDYEAIPYTEANLAQWLAEGSDDSDDLPLSHLTLQFNYVAGQGMRPTCSQNCYSNVLFLPGLEGSRLYEQTGSGEKQLWEPWFLSDQSDAQDLYLNPDGTSINPIYTKSGAVIDQAGASVFGVSFDTTDIYKTFLAQLAQMKASSTIEDFLAFPYDWRMSPEDVVNKGTQYNDGVHYLDQELIALASTSKTGKVTIVAHSNGGLVAKALMIKLQQEGKANLVDKIMLVDVPQTGTPLAIPALLHGDFEIIPGWAGFVVSQATARGLGENMPDAYDLLPSTAYFAKIATPVVDLSQAPSLRAESGVPGTVTTAAQLAKFLTTGRKKPVFLDTETPNLLSSSLLLNADLLHSDLDNWMPPAGVQVIQIAGWGLDTPSGVAYSEQLVAQCQSTGCTTATTTRHTVNMTEDGDQTVVTASQVATTSWPTYYLNLNKYRNDTGKYFNHSDITEMQPFEDLFSLLLASSSPQALPAYVTTSQPAPASLDKELRLRVLSPVTLDAYDSTGRHTGMAANPNGSTDPDNDLYVQEQIPGSYYQMYGEGQYIGLPATGTYKIVLHGEDTGTFTFQVTPVAGGIAGAPVSFTDVPVTASSTATIQITGSAPASTTLALDINGDGKVDAMIASSSQTTDPLSYAKLIKASIAQMDIGDPVQKQLQAKLTNTIYLISKVDQWDDDDADARDTSKADKVSVRVVRKLDKIDDYIQKEIDKPVSKRDKDERITNAQGAAILDMIEELKTLVNAKL